MIRYSFSEDLRSCSLLNINSFRVSVISLLEMRRLKEPWESVKANKRQKILILGKTGSGKSSLCNALSGNQNSVELFQSSAGADSCTQRNEIADVFLMGDEERPVNLIDTVGFDDKDKNLDDDIISDLLATLQERVDYIHTFVITLNGQNSRFDKSLEDMLKIFEEMFGLQFWQNTFLLFTHMEMNAKSQKKRMERRGKSDEDLAEEFRKAIEKQFPYALNLKIIFLDALYDKSDSHEVEMFSKNLEKLWQTTSSASGIPTSSIRIFISDNRKLEKLFQEKQERHKLYDHLWNSETASDLKDSLELLRNTRKRTIAELKSLADEIDKYYRRYI